MSLFRICVTVLAILALALPAAAQLPGNNTLQGGYYFRYVGVNVSSTTDKAMSAVGTLTFDGNGGYQVTGQQINSNGSGTDQNVSLSSSGKYQVLSNGVFTMGSPFAQSVTLFGGVGRGPMIVASSTDFPYCDLFVAIPASTTASNSTLSGTYYLGSIEFPTGNFAQTRNTFFSIAPDGRGSLGNVTVSGTSIPLKNAATTQTSASATYSVSANGSGTLTMPAPAGVAAANQLFAGTKNLYVSPDGNVVLGGSPTGYDIFVGVKALSTTGNTQPLTGLYFTGLLQNDTSGNGIYASQGAANEVGPQGLELVYERANPEGVASYDLTYDDSFTFDPNGTVSYDFSKYAAGAGGNVVVGSGASTNYMLQVYVKTPAITTPSGVFLNPMGVQNAASNAPFLAQVSPGEFLTLYGSGLSSQTVVAGSLPFPTTLNNVQVTINDTPMPIYYVSAGAISAIVPYTAPSDGSFVNLKVINNGVASNIVTLYSGITSPGVFTIPPGGVGNGAILHPDFSVVSPSSPAKVGEVVQIFLTGLGPVSDNTAAGSAAPSKQPFSTVANSVDVYIDGIKAAVSYQGLAPGLAGLYQLNATIPTGVTAGTSVDLDIETVDASHIMTTIPIAK